MAGADGGRLIQLSSQHQFVFEFSDNSEMFMLLGPYDENLILLEDVFAVKFVARGASLVISGGEDEVRCKRWLSI